MMQSKVEGRSFSSEPYSALCPWWGEERIKRIMGKCKKHTAEQIVRKLCEAGRLA